MLIAIALIAILSLGGLAITYLFEREEPMLWRISAGCVIGHCVFGTLLFLTSFLLGFSSITIAIAVALTLTPVALLSKPGPRRTFIHDWAKAKGKLQGATAQKFALFGYYAFFFVLFVFFFDRAMIVNDLGIFTGGSQDLGDLPFHLGIIFGFADGANFPPQNPSFAEAKFAYPFVADLTTAAFVKIGIDVRESMFVQNVAWAFSLLVILEHFVYKLAKDHIAAKLAPALLFFSGGLGFLWFLSDFGAQSTGFLTFLANIPKDYTIGPDFRWGNSLVTLFITQRSLLLGMPLTLIVLGCLWKTFIAGLSAEEDANPQPSIFGFPLSIFVVGLIAGLLPLIHLHSLVVLFIVTVFLFAMRPAKWRDWVAFAAGVCIIAVPELLWSITGSASHASEFFEFHFGWDAGETNIVWFWIKNTGLFIPLLIFGIYTLFLTPNVHEREKKQKKKRSSHAETIVLPVDRSSLLLFYIPFAFLFVLANIAKLAPWEWDNIKVLIYWFVGSLPFVGLALAWMWRYSAALKIAAAACFLILVFSGALDVLRTVSGAVSYKVFDADAVTIANRIKGTTKPDALFLNAPTYNTAVVLSGRRSLMRYPGHLSSHGIDYKQRESDVAQMYRGGPAAAALLEKYGIDYVLISPIERSSLSPNEAFFATFPLAAESGQYKIYKVRNSE